MQNQHNITFIFSSHDSREHYKTCKRQGKAKYLKTKKKFFFFRLLDNLHFIVDVCMESITYDEFPALHKMYIYKMHKIYAGIQYFWCEENVVKKHR